MNRLTDRLNGKAFFYSSYNKTKTSTDTSGRTFGDVAEKLAQYEDAEDAGLLLILPKGFNKEDALMALCNSDICPADFGLKGMFNNIYECQEHGTPCPDCWKTALKGDRDYERESD